MVLLYKKELDILQGIVNPIVYFFLNIRQIWLISQYACLNLHKLDVMRTQFFNSPSGTFTFPSLMYLCNSPKTKVFCLVFNQGDY